MLEHSEIAIFESLFGMGLPWLRPGYSETPSNHSERQPSWFEHNCNLIFLTKIPQFAPPTELGPVLRLPRPRAARRAAHSCVEHPGCIIPFVPTQR
jgi:hypothetical protein